MQTASTSSSAFRIDLVPRPGHPDARGPHLLAAAQQLGVSELSAVTAHDVFFLQGAGLTEAAVRTVVDALLLDPVVCEAHIAALSDVAVEQTPGAAVVEVAPLPGTTDSEGESLLAAAHGLGVTSVQAAGTATRYALHGASEAAVDRLARGLLANEVVERFTVDAPVPPPFVTAVVVPDAIETVPLCSLDDEGLLAVSKARRLSLDLHEMRAVQKHYQGLGREPRDAELEMFAQTWSEHCVHKTFKARIALEENGERSVVDSMFKTYIMKATEEADKPWLASVFVDNAGIVDFVPGWQLAFKAETHNHPSALEPFGGANTGVGGVIRDILGVSARPIACTDVLCFGPPDLAADEVPDGVLHPRRVASGVIAGVGDYGNKMGLPTVDGAVFYDRGYVANPLVYVGCVGVLPAGSHPTAAAPGDFVVCIGGRTGRDGLRGATFSSMEMDVETADIAGTAVQIGHPIHEKQCLEVVVRARDAGLYSAITDCGAGGLSSAVGEMAEKLGARIHLERLPLKYDGLAPWEIWLSEAQERMVLAVPPAQRDAFQALCDTWGVEACFMGTFTGDAHLLVTHQDTVVVDLPMAVLHEGIPQRQLKAVWNTPTLNEPSSLSGTAMADLDVGAELLGVLATPNVRSKEDIVRTYDHEIQGGTLVKPFVGPEADGPSDATVLRPLDVVLATGEAEGAAAVLSVGINPQYGKIDPYAMAWACVDEAVRNAVCVGANPDRIALLDNFCWGNPNLPDRLGGLVRCARGCYDAAVAFDAPFISGKDSLNNEYTGADGKKHAIPGTLLISLLGVADDLNATTTMDAKRAGDVLLLVGETRDELGGSALYARHGELGANVPQPHKDLVSTAGAVAKALRTGHVAAAHDVSDGGLLVAVAEMCLAGRLGARLDLGAVSFVGDGRSDHAVGFSESLGRYLLEVPAGDAPVVVAGLVADGATVSAIGQFVHAADGQPAALSVTGLSGATAAHVTVPALVTAFTGR